MTLPTWLARHIETTTGAPAGARRATGTRCRRCRSRLLTGLDHDVCAGQAVVDPAPITPLGEVLALLAGRNTYRLVAAGHARYELDARHAWDITAKPAATVDVLAEHQCNSPPLPAAEWTRAMTYSAPCHDDPPF